MANWVNITMTITGDIKKIEDKLFKDGEFTFNAVEPMPDELRGTTFPVYDNKNEEELIKKYGYSNWYEWCLNNWGVKWDACETYIPNKNNGGITISFESPWSIPEIYLIKLSNTLGKDYEVHIEFIEEQGAEFLGDFTLIDGDVVRKDIPEPWSKEAYERMFEMWDNGEDYEWDQEHAIYVYKEEN